jgi:alanine dehydrogenase
VNAFLDGDAVAALLDPDACLEAVTEAFRQHGSGEAAPPGVLAIAADGGGFHVKAGLLRLDRLYFAAKINGNFAGNDRRGLPRIQGVVLLADGSDGTPLAIMDSAEITALRTAAATALAARHLALPDASVVTLCGCGAQARAHLRALARVRPVRRALVCDLDPARARSLAAELAPELGIEVRVAPDLREAALASHILVTLTPSTSPILFADSVPRGAFVAAVGADAPDKQELDPALVAASTIVTDVRAQCAEIGELHHALRAGLLRIEDVHADLGEVVAGRRPGRRSAEEVIVFDSTGMALQDAAAAAVVYGRSFRAPR